LSVFALDSKIMSLYFRGNAEVLINIEKAVKDDHSIIIPPIAYYEVKRSLILAGANKQLKIFKTFCTLFPVGELGDYLLDDAIDLYIQERTANRNTGDADLLTAAFCMRNNYVLATDDIKRFENINGLFTADWTKVW